MKCNIKYGVKIQEKNVIRCCICGEEIAVQESNNPYPVRDWSAIVAPQIVLPQVQP